MTAASEDAPGPVDGRTARSARTRTAVVTALLDLIRAGNPRPTAKEIAEEAGISLRSVYVHFDDLEDLFVAAANEQVARLVEVIRPVPSAGALDERIDAFVEQRVRVWETLGAVRRAAALQAPVSPALARVLEAGRAAARAEVSHVFAAELDRLDPGRRAVALDVVDAFSGGDVWQHLMTVPGGSAGSARAALSAVLHTFLGGR